MGGREGGWDGQRRRAVFHSLFLINLVILVRG